ncbi:potassium uptake protein, integral membrane component, KtrD [Bacillus sp. JCM 19046]|uniref:Trk-type K+ transport system membrane component n=1 Tax=Shouchella xiaoxiensis TaxID=766895 RepID=A0ABS2SX51_9BACI|nr:TrkH family potassium uptake protein [Shouchella xiaoxiensis]MBM7840112.1 Trk-type K+ transport system membrane component [Shouchella xiaoxiensis]GAF18131.1 potassium uptake protein, integral membrane component, KtrD [Bacillus sp. JCM 19046]
MNSRKRNPFRLILYAYIIAMFVFSMLLYLPIFHEPGVDLSYKDALFTSVSAVSVTGLVTINVVETFNTAGILVLALAIQMGGVGIMTLGTFAWILFGRRVNVSQKLLIMVDQNRVQNQFSGLVKLMSSLLLIALMIEGVAAVLLGTYYLQFFENPIDAYIQGAFAALSAFTNAGFDLTGQSLIPFVDDYVVQILTILLIFAGSIGFPVLLECTEYLKSRKRTFKFSLFTKLSTATYFIVFIIGALGIWFLEKDLAFANLNWHEQISQSVFFSATARSAGLSTVDLNVFHVPVLLFLSCLMIIGASPSSVGGGIRTTTLAVMALSIKSFTLGRKHVQVFGRRIHEEDQQKSFIVISIFAFMFIVAMILIMYFEQGSGISLVQVFVETASAFGTCGLSLGVTSELTFSSQVVLMVLMLIGRVGIVALLFSLRKEEEPDRYRYATERIIIG